MMLTFLRDDWFLKEGTPSFWRVLFDFAACAIYDELGPKPFGNEGNVHRLVNTIKQVVRSGTWIDDGLWERYFKQPCIVHEPGKTFLLEWGARNPLKTLYLPDSITANIVLGGFEFNTRSFNENDKNRTGWGARVSFLSMFREWALGLMRKTPWPCSIDRLREIYERPGWPSLDAWNELKEES